MVAKTTERSGSVVESHKGYDPRTILFYFVIAVMLLYVIGGIAFQQLFKSDEAHELERVQNQRRILIPGPRGNIYDREGRLLVGNRPRFAVSIHLDELRRQFRDETIRVRKNYRELEDKDIPSYGQMIQIARYSVVQGYLDKVNAILGRSEKVDAKKLARHYAQSLLLPYTLIEDLKPEEYAKLLEQLPVKGPVQVYASSARHYPYKSAAAHLLGYVQGNDEIEADSIPGEDLATFKIRGTVGKIGIEAEYDSLLQGETGGLIYRVDPSGYRVDPPLDRRLPIQGRNFTTSIDIDIQLAAEEALDANRAEADDTKVNNSAAVVLDVKTGEVLAIASKPDFDLNLFSPRLSQKDAEKINADEAWMNRAITGQYPPGSTFKIFTSVAGLHAGTITSTETTDCPGYYQVGKRSFPCHNKHAHGIIEVRQAIAKSCNVFFYDHGLQTGVDRLVAEARRVHFGQRTGIEIPSEKSGLFPDPAWKKEREGMPWFDGDTANISIGQGAVLVTPLQMACFTASVARGEAFTQPTIEHHANRVPQHNESLGLTPTQAALLREGMEECIRTGTGRTYFPLAFKHSIRVAGKTGTAQKPSKTGMTNFAWFICYAPADKPEVAVAVMVEGDKADEEYGGGVYAAPVAGKILQRYFDKKEARLHPPTTITLPTAGLNP